MIFNIAASSQQLQEKKGLHYILCFGIDILKGLFCVFSPGMAHSHSRQLYLANKNIHIVIRNCFAYLFHFLGVKCAVTFLSFSALFQWLHPNNFSISIC